MNETGEVELRTERLILRPVRASDVDHLVEMHEDPAVLRFFGPMSREYQVEWLLRAEREWAERGHGRFAIVARKSGAFLGRSGLRWWPEFGETEVGWVLHPAARGRGVATEAARACLEWGFREFDLPYVTAMVAPENVASSAVAERLGMSPLREDVLFDAPVVVYVLGRDRFEAAGAGQAASAP